MWWASTKPAAPHTAHPDALTAAMCADSAGVMRAEFFVLTSRPLCRAGNPCNPSPLQSGMASRWGAPGLACLSQAPPMSRTCPKTTGRATAIAASPGKAARRRRCWDLKPASTDRRTGGDSSIPASCAPRIAAIRAFPALPGGSGIRLEALAALAVGMSVPPWLEYVLLLLFNRQRIPSKDA